MSLSYGTIQKFKLKNFIIFSILNLNPLIMIKRILLLFGLIFIPVTLSAQGRITEEKVEEVLVSFENTEVDILEVKTKRKWKALELSHEMKSKMDYDVILVKYIARGSERIVIIDQNLVPLRYDYLTMIE